MSNWSNTQLTAKGLALDAKVSAGITNLVFTKMKLGSGNTTAADINTMRDLQVPELILGINSCTVSEADNTMCNIVATASSADVTTSFAVKELGLYATDPDVGEILYAVMLDSNPDTMPNRNAASPVSVTYQINIVSANAADITAIIDPAGLVSVTTLNAVISMHNSSEEAHPYLRTLIANSGINILKRSHTYEVGDIAYSPLLKSYQRLECVVGGTTASTDIDVSSSTTGGVIVDGTCTWLLTDTRDGTPVGAVRGSLYLPAGYVKANGAEVQRADYPRLVALADAYNLWTDDTDAERGRFGRGDGSTTFVLPNYAGVFEQFGEDAGKYVEAGLPNIKGIVGTCFDHIRGTHVNGAFYTGKSDGTCGNASGSFYAYAVLMDASKSNAIYGSSATVQPPAITLIPIIRY